MQENEQKALEKQERKDRLRFRYLMIIIALDAFFLLYLVYEMILVVGKK